MALSIYISFGKNKGFRLIERDGPSIRMRLGIVSFCLTLTDVEQIIENLLSELREHDNKECHVEQEIVKLNSERDILEGNRERFEKQREELRQYKELVEETGRLKIKFEELLELKKKDEEQIEELLTQVSDLSDEVDEYERADIENEELKEQIDVLREDIMRLRFELEYIEIYFNLR